MCVALEPVMVYLLITTTDETSWTDTTVPAVETAKLMMREVKWLALCRTSSKPQSQLCSPALPISRPGLCSESLMKILNSPPSEEQSDSKTSLPSLLL